MEKNGDMLPQIIHVWISLSFMGMLIPLEWNTSNSHAKSSLIIEVAARLSEELHSCGMNLLGQG